VSDAREDASLRGLVDELAVLHVKDGDDRTGCQDERAPPDPDRREPVHTASVRGDGAEFLLDEKEAARVVGQFIGRGRPVGSIEFTVTDGDE
jgi:hypothetical protein